MSVELPTNNLSPVYKVKRMTDWVIGKSGKDAEGVSKFEIYGQTPALTAQTQLVLVLRNGVNDADGSKLIPVDSGETGIGGGKYLFMNATEIHVGGTVGETEFNLDPQSHEILAPEPSKVRGSRKYLFTKLFFRKDQKEETFYSSTWRFSDNARSLVFFYHEPDDEHLRIHIIRNYL